MIDETTDRTIDFRTRPEPTVQPPSHLTQPDPQVNPWITVTEDSIFNFSRIDGKTG